VINEKFDYAYRNMADAYIRLRKYKEAIESLEKVIELAKEELGIDIKKNSDTPQSGGSTSKNAQ